MKIYLVCSGGMSTSLLVERMKKEASNQKIAYPIEAIPLANLETHLDDAACILVAPQVRHQSKQIQALAEKHRLPVAVIDTAAYGAIDGQAILNQALQLIHERKNLSTSH